VVQVSEVQKPTAGVDQVFYALMANVSSGVEMRFDGLLECWSLWAGSAENWSSAATC